jgi:hypothetical protein
MSNLYMFQGYTLVDVTATGVTRSKDQDNMERNQHRNWETLLQCIGLRTQPQHITVPCCIDEFELTFFKFGEFYAGKQRVWTWKWAVESSGVYDLPNEPLGGLLRDFEQVPIVTGLGETARFMLPIFYPHGAIKNIYFTQLTKQ